MSADVKEANYGTGLLVAISIVALMGSCAVRTKINTPKVGEVYAIYPDAWCTEERFRVMGVQGEYVKLRKFLERSTLTTDRVVHLDRFGVSLHYSVYERDPYNCPAPSVSGDNQ